MGADLEGADLSDANLEGADLMGADLEGADLRGDNLTSANLHGANLTGAILCGADLSDADLEGANLMGADLEGADLSDADLRDANLYNAILRGADLTGTKLPSPPQILGANWGEVTPELAVELVRYDASLCPDGERLFEEWAKGGPCPFEEQPFERAANFKERKELWSPGPAKNALELVSLLLETYCKW